MAPASNEEQFKFLISCIRYSNNGKVDFGQVAKECKIVSKGAAAKRYERMMKSHGIASNAASIKPAPRSSMKSERRESGSSATKKRKTDAFLDEANTADDDEGGYGSNIKSENEVSGKEQFVVKEEEQQVGQLSLTEAANLMQYYESPATYGTGGGVGGHVDAEETYKGGDCGAGSSGYASSMVSAYGMQSSQPYDFSLPYGSMSLSNVHPRSERQGMSYRPMTQYSANDQGRFDSPVVLE